MTLGMLLRGIVLQGNVHISVWEDGDEQPSKEEWFEYIDGSNRPLYWAKKNKLLTKRVNWVFSQNDYLHIEAVDE